MVMVDSEFFIYVVVEGIGMKGFQFAFDGFEVVEVACVL